MERPADYDYGWKPYVKLPPNLIRLPRTRQGTSWTCGCAAIQSLMRYYGPEFDMREDQLIENLKSNSIIGTSFREVKRFLEEKSFIVTIQQNLTVEDIKAYVDHRDPILVCFQAWVELGEDGKEIDFEPLWDDGHYALIVGYDKDNFFFMDPSTLGQFAYIPIGEFQTRWHDLDGEGENATKLIHWGMTVAHTNSKEETLDEFAFYLG